MKAYREFPDPRSIPMVGRGVRGTIPGTDPLQAVIAKEGRRQVQPEERPAPIERGIVSAHYNRRGAPLHVRGTRESGRFFKR